MSLFGGTISALENGLNYSTTKGKVISQNIANVDTPNYKAKDVRFKDFLSEAQTKNLEAYRTENRHIQFKSEASHPGVFNFSDFRYRHDNNGVDMDKEQSDLASNQIYYNAVVDRLNEKLNTLNNVVRGGR